MTEQLRMFMTPAEIMAERKVSGLEIEDEDIVGDTDDKPYDAEAALQNFWERKLYESDDDALYDRISSEGVRTPINLGPEHIGNGHHRIAVVNDLNPNQFVPVLHYPSHRDAMRAGFDMDGNLTHQRWRY